MLWLTRPPCSLAAPAVVTCSDHTRGDINNTRLELKRHTSGDKEALVMWLRGQQWGGRGQLTSAILLLLLLPLSHSGLSLLPALLGI